MIRFTPHNLKRPIDLLHEHKPNQLMREGDLSEAELRIGALEHVLGQAKRAADDEGD